LVSWVLIASEDAYPIYDLIPYGKLYSRYFGRGLLFKPYERTWNHCNEYPSEDLWFSAKIHMAYAIFARETGTYEYLVHEPKHSSYPENKVLCYLGFLPK
jgi:hypothetical protein